MKRGIILVLVLSALLISIGGCMLPPPWPDRDDRYEHDKNRGDHDHDRDRRERDYEGGRGGHDHDRARDNN